MAQDGDYGAEAVGGVVSTAVVYGRGGQAPEGAERPSPALRRLVPPLRLGGAWQLVVPLDEARDVARRLRAWGWEPEHALT